MKAFFSAASVSRREGHSWRSGLASPTAAFTAGERQYLMLRVGWQGLYEWYGTMNSHLLQLLPGSRARRILLQHAWWIAASLCPVLRIDCFWQGQSWQSWVQPQSRERQRLYHLKVGRYRQLDNPTDLGTSHLASNVFEAPQEQESPMRNCNTALPRTNSRCKTSPLYSGQMSRTSPGLLRSGHAII